MACNNILKFRSIDGFQSHLFNFFGIAFTHVWCFWVGCGGKMREREREHERTRTLWLKAKGKSKAFTLNASWIALVTSGLVEYTLYKMCVLQSNTSWSYFFSFRSFLLPLPWSLCYYYRCRSNSCCSFAPSAAYVVGCLLFVASVSRAIWSCFFSFHWRRRCFD